MTRVVYVGATLVPIAMPVFLLLFGYLSYNSKVGVNTSDILSNIWKVRWMSNVGRICVVWDVQYAVYCMSYCGVGYLDIWDV